MSKSATIVYYEAEPVSDWPYVKVGYDSSLKPESWKFEDELQDTAALEFKDIPVEVIESIQDQSRKERSP